jgi:hypothetical protein
MSELAKVETLPVAPVAKALGISPMKVKYAILNHTLPIGAVCREPGSTKDRIVIVKERWDKWIAGQL